MAPAASADGEARGLEPCALADVYRSFATKRCFSHARSFLVVRDGVLVAERYFRPHLGPRRTNLKSATKSILSLLVGVAVDEGAIDGVETELAAIAPQLVPPDEPDKARITVGDLLTLQAGLAWDEWARRYRDPRRMLRSSNPASFVMEKPLIDKPGSVFRYSSGTSQVLATVLAVATGMSPLAYARARLFAPLGIQEVRWPSTRDRVSCGGTHLFLTPRQMAVIGQLCLQKGLWMDRRIVSARWIENSTSVQAGRDWWEGPYGYHWWVRPQGFTAYGYGGQFIYVVPAAGLVLVVTASPNRRRHILLHDFERFVVEPLLASLHTGDAGDHAADTTNPLLQLKRP